MTQHLDTTDRERILEETKRIEAAEKRIQREEKEILQAENKILHELSRDTIIRERDIPKKVTKAKYLRNIFLRRSHSERFAITVISVFGGVLAWRGLWLLADVTPILSYAVVSLCIGLLILWYVDLTSDNNS